MARGNIKVPFGYEPPAEQEKGTLIYYDTFEQITDSELEQFMHTAEQRSFATVVLYPLHEETARRMSKLPISPFHKRAKRLDEWKQEYGHLEAIIQNWDGKRKKYTPVDTALKYLADTYPAPYFVYMAPETAEQFASYSSFEGWITRIRLILTHEPQQGHPRLEQFRHRWESVH
ncbi:hypothetical protein [Paenibacillus massiliensis]|uniref:hypothetical protein n=1 Tax=Paenibacillus massiliensis TaxID=225917 RepID=UPI00040020D1|nr:hypothetical protein [Paenibacillus massiliensis]